jgi:DNA topoisomerase-1
MHLANSDALTAPPHEVARSAGLIYVSDEHPGITRQHRGKTFSFKSADGKAVRDAETLRRIKSLAIPPAWTEVWICPRENGHIQATGRDARGRKQYRYHPRWREVRDESKYGRMMAFGEALPRIRQRVERDLKATGMPRHKVLATVTRLLETTLIRVGNDEYAQSNKSYGLTTLRNGHVKVRGPSIVFDFVGKSGKRHRIDMRDPRLARTIRRCQELPGQELFCYVDDDGQPRDVTSGDVNDYLREIAGAEFTAKDFRTWSGTALAAIALQEFEQFTSTKEAKRNIVKAIEAVAQMLGNTPAICRKCYVHPAILDSYLEGQTIATLRQAADQRLKKSLSRLRPAEAAVMMLLRERLAAASREGGGRTARALVKKKRRVPPALKRHAASPFTRRSRPPAPAAARSARSRRSLPSRGTRAVRRKTIRPPASRRGDDC